jgi:hypothetical protein
MKKTLLSLFFIFTVSYGYSYTVTYDTTTYDLTGKIIQNTMSQENIDELTSKGQSFEYVQNSTTVAKENYKYLKFNPITKTVYKKTAEEIAIIDTPTYRELRKKEYPNDGDQLDVIMKTFDYMRKNGTDVGKECEAWISSCTAVKAKYPKR